MIMYVAIAPCTPILVSEYWSTNYEVMEEEASKNKGVVTNSKWFFAHFGYDPIAELQVHPDNPKHVPQKSRASYRDALYRSGLTLGRLTQ